MQKISHDACFEGPEDKTQITKFIDLSIDIHEEHRHEHASKAQSAVGLVGPVEDDDDDDNSVGGHVPVGDDGIGIGSVNGLRSEEICVGKGCDEQIGSEDMSNVVANHHHRRHDDNDDFPSTNETNSQTRRL